MSIVRLICFSDVDEVVMSSQRVENEVMLQNLDLLHKKVNDAAE